MGWRILHVTDFHIADLKDDRHPLSQQNYERFIDQLAYDLTARTEFAKGLDFIVATGDFVHRFHYSSFPHAAEVLRYLGIRLHIPSERIIVCPGNHDYDRELTGKDRDTKAREQFRSFASAFAKPDPRSTELFQLHEFPSLQARFISLDSTLRNSPVSAVDAGRPGIVSTGDQQILMRMVRETKPDQLLVFLAHFPIYLYDPVPAAVEDEPNWAERHLWSSAYPFFREVQAFRSDQNTIWFYGDIHRHQQANLRGQLQIVTGSLGLRPEEMRVIEKDGERTKVIESPIRRQAKTVLVGTTASEPSVYLLEFSLRTFMHQTNVGEWQFVELSVIRQKKAEDLESQQASVLQESTSEDKDRATAVDSTVRSNTSIEVISSRVEDNILDIIASGGHYRLGRFRHSKQFDALGRISVAPIMNEQSVVSDIVSSMRRWIGERLPDGWNNRIALIGVDYWGSVLATQLSVETGAPSFAITLNRLTGREAERDEVEARVDKLQACRHAMFFTDVVVTGESIIAARAEILRILEQRHHSEIVWWCLSLACDIKYLQSVNLSFLQHHATCCNLRLPVVLSRDLPSEAILEVSRD